MLLKGGDLKHEREKNESILFFGGASPNCHFHHLNTKK